MMFIVMGVGDKNKIKLSLELIIRGVMGQSCETAAPNRLCCCQMND